MLSDMGQQAQSNLTNLNFNQLVKHSPSNRQSKRIAEAGTESEPSGVQNQSPKQSICEKVLGTKTLKAKYAELKLNNLAAPLPMKNLGSNNAS